MTQALLNGEIKTGDLVYALKKEFKCLFSLDAVGKVVDIFGNDLIAGKKFDKLIETGQLDFSYNNEYFDSFTICENINQRLGREE